ncbi:MAG: hypothetical protein A2W91_10410 [Bacteroidetes bacterium GWF2_38_335]|nr:MAG: hypothetical protein A2W91_10410 [Bacteroidetes bacterium GWF2_38_335]OFY81884.1 MAG: hypothetical protein A2281_06630 [Bacteroidetes bacterium RIFOXYA12_FULL_38_20]HBS87961.1 hypothetical protein [Bacteroidales bacterium]
MKTAFKFVFLSIFLLSYSFSHAQIEDEYTDSYSVFGGLNFKGDYNFYSIDITKDRIYPGYKDFKFSGYGLSFDFYNGTNFMAGGKFFIKPLPCCLLRNPYFFPLIGLQAGYYQLAGEPGFYVRPEISLLFNSSTDSKINFRFRLAYTYDFTFPAAELDNFIENSLVLQIGLAYCIHTKPESQLRFDE